MKTLYRHKISSRVSTQHSDGEFLFRRHRRGAATQISDPENKVSRSKTSEK